MPDKTRIPGRPSTGAEDPLASLDSLGEPTMSSMPSYLGAADPVFAADTPDAWAYGPSELETLGPGTYDLRMPGNTPAWAIEEHGSPQGVYDYYDRYEDPDDREAAWFTDARQAANLAIAEEGRDVMLGDLGDIADFWGGRLREAEADPTRQHVIDELTRRSSQDYSVYSPQARSAMELQMAQSLNRARQRARLGGAGTGASGADLALDPMLTAMGAGNLSQLSGHIATENERARAQALGNLGAFNLNWEQFETGIGETLSEIERQSALLEGDPFLVESDEWLAPRLNFARESYEDWQEQLLRAQDFQDEQAEFDLSDVGNVLLNLFGEELF